MKKRDRTPELKQGFDELKKKDGTERK